MAIKHSVLHRDGTAKVYQSPATPGQFLYYTNSGDDVENGIIGKGQSMHIDNIDSQVKKSVDIQFLEDVQLKDAYFFWENAKWGDSINAEVILPAGVPFEKTDNTGNAKVINGVVTNITTSLTPDETWIGTHILAPIDIVLVRFVNNFHMFGTNNIGTVLESTGVALISKDFKLRLTYELCDDVTTPNPDINISVMAEMFREKTI